MKAFLSLIGTTVLAGSLSGAPFFNGTDLSGWTAAEMKYWSVKDGVIIGHSDENVPKNEFLWSEVEVKDFYLVLDVKLTPTNRNAGIQFRSKPINAHGQAVGYQADVGSGVWGKLYHEHGRKKLDWNTHGDKAVKHGEWNRYEILAVGHKIWTALNDTLCVAIDDTEGEFAGKIALQIHSGPPQRVEYRIVKLVHNPPLALAKHTRKKLLAALPKRSATTPAPTKPAPQVTREVPAILRPLAKPARPVPAFADGFKISRNQTIALFGGSNAAECQRHGWLEMRLVSAHPEYRVRLRNLARPTDTVYQQSRPRNFFGQIKPDYGEKDGRQQIPIDMAILWFGQMESLDGDSRVPEFIKAYEQLIEQVSAYTKRIVLIAPVPFEDPLSLGFDLQARNRNLKKYTAAIRRLASTRQLPFVEISNKTTTRDGALLSDAGHKAVAAAFAKQLGFAGELPKFSDYLRTTIREKNAIWSRYWLPSNWAFLYGNRQTQPSSRDHRDKTQRWFPKELEEFRKRAEELELQILTRVRENR